MRKLVLTSVLATIVGVVSASAADISQRRQMPTKAPNYAPIYNWTGPYIGINAGGGWGSSGVDAPFSGSFKNSGGLIGLTMGYNWQTGPTVFGLEGDIDWTNLKGSGTCAGVLGCEVRNRWLGTARGRLGYAMDRFMPYVTGGLRRRRYPLVDHGRRQRQ